MEKFTIAKKKNKRKREITVKNAAFLFTVVNLCI